MAALDALCRLVLALLRIAGSRHERRAGWLAALAETAREARVMIEAAAERRRQFESWYGDGDQWKKR